MPFTIVEHDITKINVDAIVNAANTQLLMGGGVCGAIFRAAGARELQKACDKLSPIKTGEAVITPGFKLPAKFVIHTAGPVYGGQSNEESERLLRASYINSLATAKENGCKSIAFPLISSGIYGYPREDAMEVATTAIKDFLAENDMDVYLAIVSKDQIVLDSRLLSDVTCYLEENCSESRHPVRTKGIRKFKTLSREDSPTSWIDRAPDDASVCEAEFLAPSPADFGDKNTFELDEPFNTTLLRLIDSTGKSDAEVYKRANIDRKLFSKIRSNRDYTPTKKTILALAVALELDLRQTDDLLERAGYALSHSKKFDVIVEYFIISRMYDIYKINEVLFKFDQPLLGQSE